MLRLFLNDIELVFNGTIKIKWLSPLFYDQNSYSFEFAFPACAINDAAFGFARLPDALPEAITYNNFYIDAGPVQLLGSLTIHKTSNNFYYASFIENAEIVDVYKYRLRNYTIFLGSNRITNYNFDMYYPNINTDTADIGKYKMTNNNIGNFKIKSFKLSDLFEKILSYHNIKFVTKLTEIAYDFDQLMLHTNFCPAFFKPNSNYWVKHTLISESYIENGIVYVTLKRILYQETEEVLDFWKKEPWLVHFNAVNTNWQLHNKFHTIQFIEAYEPVFEFKDTEYEAVYTAKYSLPKASYNSITAIPLNSGSDYWLATTFTDINYTLEEISQLPDITLGELIKAIEDLLFVKFMHNSNNRTTTIVSLKEILLNYKTQDITNITANLNECINSKLTGYYAAYDNNIDDPYFKEQVKDLLPEHNLKTSVSTVANLPANGNTHNDVRLVTSINSYYVFLKSEYNARIESGSSAGSWQFYSLNILPAKNNSASAYKVVSKAAPMCPHQYEQPYFYNGSYAYFYLYRVAFGAPLYFRDKPQPNTYNAIRLFFFRQQLTFTDNYGRTHTLRNATIDDKDFFLEKIPEANLSLDYSSENNPVNRCGKEWLEFMATHKTFNADVVWPNHVLYNFDFTEAKLIDKSEYMVKSIELELSAKGIEFGKTELAKK